MTPSSDSALQARTRRGQRAPGVRLHRGHAGEPSGALPSSSCTAAPNLLTWAEVNRTHRVRNGVYQRRGRLVSLLTDFGRINPCYPDYFRPASNDTIIYTGEGRRGEQHLSPGNRALRAAIKSGHAVPLFNKLAPGRWQHLGYWRVTEGQQSFDERENRMLWRFTLKKVMSDER